MRLPAPLGSGFLLLVVAACSGEASSGLSDTSCRNDIDCPATHRCMASVCVLPAGSGGAFAGGAPGAGGSVVTSGGSPSAGGTAAGGSGQGGLFGSGGAFAAGGGTATGGVSDAGSGGATVDAAPPPDARPEDGAVPTGIGVGCGTSSCTLGERCCFTPGMIFPPSSPDYACSTDACADEETSVLCDGPEDCPDTQQCCRLSSGSGRINFECRDTCPAAEIDCGGPQNCPAGTICCETTSSQGSVPERTDCAATCTGSEAWILCLVDADCPASLPTCIPSDLLPGFRRCQ